MSLVNELGVSDSPIIRKETFMKRLLALLIVVVCVSTARAGPDSLADVFPLSVGNQWTYRYLTQLQQNGSQLVVTTDSGQATYSIVDAVHASDSTSWFLREHRDLIHRYEIGAWDTTYSIQDSSTFELIENLTGHHQLYVLGDYTQQHVFFFTKDFTDTTTVARFRNVGIDGTITFESKEPGTLPPPLFHSLFTFERGVGLQEVDYAGGFVDLSLDAHHHLLSAIITSVGYPSAGTRPTTFRLFQNYPDPFNPTTTIQYSLTPSLSQWERESRQGRVRVTLKVYDLLGREVATLVDETKQPGTYAVQWDARGMASGVYVYQLKAGSFIDTKKLVLLR